MWNTANLLPKARCENCYVTKRTSGGSRTRLGLEKIRPACENSEKLINNNNDIQVFFATRRRRNLLAYNNSDKNERKKMGKWKADVLWIIVPSLLSGFEKWLRIFTTWYEFPNIWMLYIHILHCWTHINPERK